MSQFYKKYQCGKNKKLLDLGNEGTLISGIRVKQRKDYSFEWDMKEYANKIKPIEVPRGYISQNTEIDDHVMSDVISVNGKLGWLGGSGRPDLAAAHSIIAGAYKHKLPSLVSDCNSCVKQAKDHDIVLKVWPIPVKDIRFVTFCDSSFDFQGERHQQGWIVGFTNQFLNQNRKAPVSIAMWKSRK